MIASDPKEAIVNNPDVVRTVTDRGREARDA